MTHRRSLSTLLAILVCVVFGAAANAASFTETLTTDDFLNNGYVSESSPLSYVHTFDSGESVGSVSRVFLAVTVTDDFECIRLSGCFKDWFWQAEDAVLSLNSVPWQEGDAGFRLFWGEITDIVEFDSNGDLVDVAISSAGGDFQVWKSELYVDYEIGSSGGGASTGGGGSAVPEPSAALLFLVGGLTIAASQRKH